MHSNRSEFGLAKWISEILELSMEMLCYAMVIASPWFFACLHPPFEHALSLSVASVIALAGIKLILDGSWPASGSWYVMLPLVGLGSLSLVAWLQILPLSESWIQQLSPNTLEWIRSLNLETPEAHGLPVAKLNEDAWWRAGNGISLNPGGSFHFAVRLVALAAFFAAVSSFRQPQAVLRRLSVVATVVGVALAMLALAQSISSSNDRYYWFFEANSSGFGPFMNKNHYPFFANLTLGLAFGLLFTRMDQRPGRRNILLTDGYSQWLLMAIILIMTSIVVSCSRGGNVAMLVSTLAVLSIRGLGGRIRAAYIPLVVGPLLGILGLLVWLGFDLLESRLVTLSAADTYTTDGRWHLWAAALEGWSQFPVFGSGGETFRYWETIFQAPEVEVRRRWNSFQNMAFRADNEFLDIACEYGLLGLAGLTICAVTCLKRCLGIAYGQPLAAGGAISLLAVTLHSCCDFGLRMPSTAVFACLLASLLCSLNRDEGTRIGNELSGHLASHATRRPWRMALLHLLVATLLLAISVGFVFVQQRYAWADYWREMGLRFSGDGRGQALMRAFDSAVSRTPQDVELRIDAARSALNCARKLSVPKDAKIPLLEFAMLRILQAQQLCPIAWEPYAWAGAYLQQTGKDKPALQYLRHAHRLHPSDPSLSFQLGEISRQSDGSHSVLEYWRESLSFSDRHFDAIMNAVGDDLSGQQLLADLLPPHPPLLLAAGDFLNGRGRSEEARIVVGKALELLLNFQAREREKEKQFAFKRLEGEAHLLLGAPEEAIQAFQQALTINPESADVRLSWIETLISLGELKQAFQQTQVLLSLHPEHYRGRQLLKLIEQMRLQGSPQAKVR
ncbi:MAG: O-antigen ligase family protein [bacterium]|nr:O-antigen ligase family protein [bacterium]